MALRREDDKLRLDLSLFSGNHYDLRPNLSAEPPFSASVRPPSDEFSSEIRNSGTYRVEARTFLKNIDVNRAPELDGFNDEEEEEGVATSPAASSPSSTVSNHSLNGTKRGLENDSLLEEERPSSRGGNMGSDEEDASRKKLRLSKEQSAVLEESFKGHPTLNPKQKVALAKQLNLRPRQVEVWFQNRRARTKLKQTEVDCEFLKRCCENLTEENRRLQRELQELRALKLSPQFYMPVPATTLTMCPSCEKFTGVAATSVAGNNCHIPPSAVVPFQMRGFDMPSRSR